MIFREIIGLINTWNDDGLMKSRRSDPAGPGRVAQWVGCHPDSPRLQVSSLVRAPKRINQ